jgi:hypothetical protein
MAGKKHITADYVRDRLDYNPKTGELRWRTILETDRFTRTWNTRYAGKVAGCLDVYGRRVIRLDGFLYFSHQLAWLYFYSRWPHPEIDHKNRNMSDNRIDNLRIATSSQNKHNKGKLRTNTSGYKGVTWHSQTNKWAARIWLNNKPISLGLFQSKEDAAAAYARAAEKLHGHFKCLA